MLDGLLQEARLGRRPVHAEDLAAAAFLGSGFVPLVGQKTFEHHQQEGAELALCPGDGMQIVLVQQPREELLGEVLGIGRAVALAADVGVKRMPIGAAEGFEGRGRLRGWLLARREHHRPVRGQEPRLRGSRRFAAGGGHNGGGRLMRWGCGRRMQSRVS